MSVSGAGSQSDPKGFVEAPIVAALNNIMVRSVIGFCVVAASASLPLILHLDPEIHEAFHFALPVGWVAFAAVTAVVLALRRAPPEPDVWGRAADVDVGLARFARRLSAVMKIGWLAALGGVLVHHHLGSPRDIFVTAGIIVPLTLAAWFLAVLAWNAWERASLARAEHEADGRLRQYWKGMGRPIGG